MDDLHTNIVNQIVVENPNISSNQRYELFLQRISLLDEKYMKDAGVVTPAYVKYKISPLKRVDFASVYTFLKSNDFGIGTVFSLQVEEVCHHKFIH